MGFKEIIQRFERIKIVHILNYYILLFKSRVGPPSISSCACHVGWGVMGRGEQGGGHRDGKGAHGPLI